MHNEQDLKNTPEYRSGMFRIVTCPVCGHPTLDMYWICAHCGWEYDIELQTEDEESPCNGMSLRAYRELYKTGGISMNVTICSRKAAEELLRTDTLSRTAVISFCDPPSIGKPVPMPPLDYAGKAALNYDTYMPEADALAAFICQARADGLDILCQCEYGQSRSAACAAAILEYFNGTGISVFADYRYYPNQVVYHKVMDALTRYGQEAQPSA